MDKDNEIRKVLTELAERIRAFHQVRIPEPFRDIERECDEDGFAEMNEDEKKLVKAIAHFIETYWDD